MFRFLADEMGFAMLTFNAHVKQVCFQVDQDFNGVGVELRALGGKVQFFVA